MIRYIIGRVAQMVPVLFGVLLLVFSITNIIPGDPVLLMLDVRYTEREYKEMQVYLGLDKPLTVQFANHVKGVLRGNLGKSIRTREPVTPMIFQRFPATFTLALAAMFFVVVISIPIGVIAALKQNSKIDYISMIVAELGISMPVFWLGMMMILLFSLYLGWLPASGRGDPPDLIHLIMPAFCLATPYMAMTARLTRSCMLEVLRENYIVAARSRGFSEMQVVLKHALRNAMIPVVTNIGLQLSRMLGGALVIEVVFRWPGIGSMAYDGVMEKDYPVVMGVVLMVAVIFIIINILVDLSYTLFDPRIRYGATRS
jgi:ABC-type dipeptide/oligopeptide/nickel transport system permease component